MSDDKKKMSETHPSYGMVAFHRIQGGNAKLFGSHLDNHPTRIRLVIKEGMCTHDLSTDWYRGLKSIVEVDLSPAQFSELLTTMNIGDGVPCTIARRDGKLVEPIPDDIQTEPQKVIEGFSNSIIEKMAKVRVNRKKLRALLNKKGTFKKSDKEEVWSLVEEIFQHFEANSGFVLTTFSEAIEKVTTEAKAQVDHYITGVLARLGMEKLKNNFGKAAFFDKLLVEGTVEENTSYLVVETESHEEKK